MKMSFLQTYGSLIIAIAIGTALGAALGYFGQCTSGTCPITSTWWRGALYGGFIGFLFGVSSYSKRRDHIDRPPRFQTDRSQVPEIPRRTDSQK